MVPFRSPTIVRWPNRKNLRRESIFENHPHQDFVGFRVWGFWNQDIKLLVAFGRRVFYDA